ncbi:hypothetical protein LAM01_15190 [Amylolactobacillus amylophilus]|nr:hypothetical protein LAM01_15190 [Amylolactobacillus amylophilus]
MSFNPHEFTVGIIKLPNSNNRGGYNPVYDTDRTISGLKGLMGGN